MPRSALRLCLPDRVSRARLLTVATLALLSLIAVHLARAGEPTAQQRAWALAAAALLTEQNGDRHDILAGVELSPGHVERVKRILRDWWGVTDRGGLLASLRWLEESGHRAPFASLGARLAALNPAERRTLQVQRQQDFRLNQKVGVVEMHYERLGAKGLRGWDFARFLSLCRWGYAAGYLTEEEAWARMIPASRTLRHTFTSWRDLGENYLIGRQFWDPEEYVRSGHRYRKAFDRLLSDPDSPWNRVPWALDFGPPRPVSP
jgi:Protein of unknown function (DUF1266)